jgi:hypothetical protein
LDSRDARRTLLGLCKSHKVRKWSGVKNQHSTNAFVEYMYDRLNGMMDEYEVTIFHWPEYTYHLEKAIADIEKAIVKALYRQYADVLTPLKGNPTSKIYGLKYVKKIAKRSGTYVVPDGLGIILNSMRRMLEILRPEIETKLISWSSCIPNYKNTTREDCFIEVTVMLRSYFDAVVEKLAENTRLRGETKLNSKNRTPIIIKKKKKCHIFHIIKKKMPYLPYNNKKKCVIPTCHIFQNRARNAVP